MKQDHEMEIQRNVSLGIILACVMAFVCIPVQGQAAAPPQVEEEAIQLLEQTSQAFTRVGQSAIPSVVFITTEQAVRAAGPRGRQPGRPFDFFDEEFFRRFFGQPHGRDGDGPPQRERRIGQGSGFIISQDGYILTNNHVVEGAEKIMVRLYDGREFEASHVGGDPRSEVAVIRIEADADLPAIALGDSDLLEIGEWVIAIGNPFGLSESLTVGVVSAKGRSGIGLADYEDFIQTDAAINPGNSGGPLLNIHGEVIGINTAIFSRSGGYMGIGFAVPINMARTIKQQLVETGEVVRGHLGIMIQEMTSELAESFGLDEPRGILIGDVVEDSPAEEYGLRVGDILLELDGEQIANVAAFRNQVSLMAPGTKIGLTVFRDGETMDIAVEIGELEAEIAAAPPPRMEAWTEKLGLAVSTLTEEYRQRFNYEDDAGVLVSEVVRHSQAARAGIRPGQLIVSVNRTPVGTTDAFYQQLEAATNTVLLQIREGPSMMRFVALRLP